MIECFCCGVAMRWSCHVCSTRPFGVKVTFVEGVTSTEWTGKQDTNPQEIFG